MTSLRARLRLKSPTSRLITQRFVQEHIKENIQVSVTCFCEGNSPVTDKFPAQWASGAERFPFDDLIIIGMLPQIEGRNNYTFKQAFSIK